MLIPTPTNTKSITDLRENALGLMEQVKKEGIVYILHRSTPRAVMLSVDEFVRIQEALEDLQDARDAVQLAREDHGALIPLDKVLAEYDQHHPHKKGEKRTRSNSRR